MHEEFAILFHTPEIKSKIFSAKKQEAARSATFIGMDSLDFFQ